MHHKAKSPTKGPFTLGYSLKPSTARTGFPAVFGHRFRGPVHIQTPRSVAKRYQIFHAGIALKPVAAAYGCTGWLEGRLSHRGGHG